MAEAAPARANKGVKSGELICSVCSAQNMSHTLVSTCTVNIQILQTCTYSIKGTLAYKRHPFLINVALIYTHYGAIASLCIKNTLTEGNLSSEGTVSGSASEISQKLYTYIFTYIASLGVTDTL